MAIPITKLDEKKLYSLILSDDLTYEGVIRDIIRQQGMDPWDINLDVIITEYMKFLNKIRKLDFRVCGKFILTAAILLKMKSDMLKLKEEKKEREQISSEFDKELIRKLREQLGLINVEDVFAPRVPLQKKRIATIDDLLNALKEALEVKERRERRWKEREAKKPNLNLKRFDIFSKMKELYEKIKDFFSKKEKISFKELVPSDNKKDIVWTFLPLLQLASLGRVELEQEKEFGDIYIIKGVKYGERITKEEND